MTVVLRRTGEGTLDKIAKVPIEILRVVAAGAGHHILKLTSVFTGTGDYEIDARHPFDPSPDHEYTPPPRIYG